MTCKTLWINPNKSHSDARTMRPKAVRYVHDFCPRCGPIHPCVPTAQEWDSCESADPKRKLDGCRGVGVTLNQ